MMNNVHNNHPMNNRRSGRRRINRQQQRLCSFVLDRHYFVIQITLVLVTIFCILAWFWIHIATGLRRSDSSSLDWSISSSSSSQSVKELMDVAHPSSSFADEITGRGESNIPIIMKEPYQPNPRIDSVVAFLMNLAKFPPEQLWYTFGMDENKNDGKNSYGKDPFLLQELEQGTCPLGLISTAEWLPPRPWNSDEIASMFQRKVEQLKTTGRGAMMRDEETALVWYEHISKAGGTTFCGLAKTNLGRDLVPRYYCMPKKLGSKNMDGRVGSWTNEELIGYTKRESHLLVANEWDPFNLDKLALSARTLDGREPPLVSQHLSPRLLFVTTLREPSDRLLSTYLFFRKKENPPEFFEWMKHNLRRTANYEIGTKNAFRSNVARYNALVWRYSGGKLPVSEEQPPPSRKKQESQFPLPMTDERFWKDPFETAIRALAQQDLILPMDIMTKEEGQEAMRRLLGWNEVVIKDGRGKGDKESGHIVTTGKIRNSNAREYLSEEDYRFMWEANWLDNILVLWCRAVFLARLHCKDA